MHAGGGSSVPDAAYRYCRREPGAHVVLVGTISPAHLLQNIEAGSIFDRRFAHAASQVAAAVARGDAPLLD